MQNIDYEAYAKEKEERLNNINENNCDEIFNNARQAFIQKLQNLDCQNVQTVESLYLTALELLQAASYICAQKKDEPNKTIEEKLSGIAVDDLVAFITDNKLLESLNAKDLRKIQVIDDTLRPAKQSWAGTHARMLLIVKLIEEQKKTETLKSIVLNYHQYLQKRINAIKKETSSNDLLRQRYNIINGLNDKIKDKKTLTPQELEEARQSMNQCLAKKPSWFEKNIILRILDVISFGSVPVIRTIRNFFSTERKLEKEAKKILNPQKPK